MMASYGRNMWRLVNKIMFYSKSVAMLGSVVIQLLPA